MDEIREVVFLMLERGKFHDCPAAIESPACPGVLLITPAAMNTLIAEDIEIGGARHPARCLHNISLAGVRLEVAVWKHPDPKKVGFMVLEQGVRKLFD